MMVGARANHHTERLVQLPRLFNCLGQQQATDNQNDAGFDDDAWAAPVNGPSGDGTQAG